MNFHDHAAHASDEAKRAKDLIATRESNRDRIALFNSTDRNIQSRIVAEWLKSHYERDAPPRLHATLAGIWIM